MARIVVANRTLVKRITVGTPIRSIQASAPPITLEADLGSFYSMQPATERLKILGGEGLDVTLSDNAFTVSGEDASTSNKGIAQFNSSQFSVSSGTVSIDTINGGSISGPNTTIKLRFSDAADSAPGISDIETGELILNSNDGKLYYYASDTTVKAFIDSGNVQALIDNLPNAITTDDIAEGDANLYYTSARADADFKVSIQNIDRSIIPDSNEAYDLGSVDYKFRDLYLSGSTIFLGDLTLKDSAGQFVVVDSQGDTISISITSTDDVPEGSNLYYTDERVRAAISVTDAGGDGSLTYDSAVGEITYTGPSADEVRAHFSGLSGVTFNSATGEISIGQPVGPTDDVTFNDVTVNGDLIVSGTTTTLNTTELEIEDINITLASTATTSSQAGGAGFTIGGANATFTYSHADSQFQSSISFSAPELVGVYAGFDSDFAQKTTDDLTEGSSNLYYTRARFDSALGDATSTSTIRGYFSGSAGLNYNSSTGVFSVAPTGVTAGVFGSATEVPVITVDSIGVIDSIGTIAVAGVTSINFDSATGNFTINTADGNTFLDTITLDPYTTTDLVEGTNLYYTKVRVDSDIDQAFTDKSTSDLSEGTNLYYTKVRVDSDVAQGFTDRTTGDLIEGSNLYYTRARFDSALGDSSAQTTGSIRSYFSAAGDLSFNQSTGEFSIIVANAALSDSGVRSKISVTNAGGAGRLSYDSSTGVINFTGVQDTDSVPEGANLYYTKVRVDSDVAQGFTDRSTSDLVEGSNLYYTKVRVDSDVAQGFTDRSTTDVVEGTNLYYTKVRVDSDIDQAFNDKSTTDLSEGSNLYYTKVRVDSDVAQGFTDRTTDDLTQGTTNLYYDSNRTTITARYSLQPGTGVSYEASIGEISIGQPVGTTDSVTFNGLRVNGNTYIGGDLTVAGTTTTVNSTEVTIDDTNIVLGDNAADSTQIDGAGITIGGASYSGVRPTITYSNLTNRWNLNKALTVSRVYGDLTGDVTGTVSDISNHSTSDLTEGTNLYYTKVRVDSDVAQGFTDRSTTNLVEGNNLYYTKVRVDSDIDQAFDDKSTTNLSEGTNLYYTKVRVDSDVAQGFTDRTTADLAEGSNLYYTKVRVDSDIDQAFNDKSTSDLSEGTNLYYTTARADSDAKSALVGGTGLTYDSASGTFSITNTGVIASTYGSASNIPVITINAQGQIDSAGVVAVAGVDSVGYNTGTGAFTVFTADGGSASANITLEPFTTTNLVEGTNLYYTKIRTDSDVAQGFTDRTTTDLTEGNNLYYTKVRVDSDIDQAFVDKSTTDLSEGTNLYYTKVRTDSDVAQGFTDRTTTDLAEGNNLYYTKVRVDSDVAQGFTDRTTTDVAEGSNLYYTKVRVDSDVAQGFTDRSTSDLVEGSNLYYTTARADSDARSAILVVDAGGDGSLAYDSALGKITYTGPSASEVRAHFSAGTGVTITSGEVAIGQPVSTTSDVTFAKITGDSASLGQVNFQTDWVDSHIGFTEGAMWYDPHHKNLNYYADIDHPIEIGMQIVERVYNNTGSEIPKGSPLYYSGNYTNDAGQESPTVALADATSASAYNVQGLASEPIANGSYGFIVVAGVIDGFDTSNLNAGQNFFAGLTPGALQNAAPTYPNYPMCLGWVIVSDSSDGKVIINQQNHSVNSFRVQGDTHIGADLRVDGDLTVVGSQIITSTENVSIGGNIQYLNSGNTIGQSGTTFVGTGLDDAFYSGHYSGDSATKSFFVKIDATGTPDTFEWGFDSSIGTEATGIAITGSAQLLDSAYGISIDFGATTGHTLGDKWTGTATAVDIDTGIFSNRHTGTDYTHVGLFFDVSENKWTFLNDYEPEPETTINLGAAGTVLGAVKAATFEGDLTGDVTGNADTATILATGRNFSISGDASAPNVSFNGSGPVDLVMTLDSVNSNVGSFGSASQVPVITVNSKGLVTAASTVSVAAVSSINFDSATGNFQINTADGGVFVETITLDPFTTTNLSEGNNLYYTTARADSDFDVRLATKTTSNLAEGTNLYYTSARADSDAKNALIGGTGITYTSSTGTIDITNTGVSANTYGSTTAIPVITINAQGQIDSAGTVPVAGVDSVGYNTGSGALTVFTADGGSSSANITLEPFTTSNLTEGNNLYYTTARADSDFDIRLATKSTDNLSEGSTNLYYDSARTQTNARNAVSVTDAGGDGSLTYSAATGVITYTGPSASEVRAHFSNGTGVTITSGEIAIGQSVATSATPSFSRLTLTQTTGTAPMTISSSTLVSNLNADLLDNQHGSYYRINVYDASGTLLN